MAVKVYEYREGEWVETPNVRHLWAQARLYNQIKRHYV